LIFQRAVPQDSTTTTLSTATTTIAPTFPGDPGTHTSMAGQAAASISQTLPTTSPDMGFLQVSRLPAFSSAWGPLSAPFAAPIMAAPQNTMATMSTLAAGYAMPFTLSTQPQNAAGSRIPSTPIMTAPENTIATTSTLAAGDAVPFASSSQPRHAAKQYTFKPQDGQFNSEARRDLVMFHWDPSQYGIANSKKRRRVASTKAKKRGKCDDKSVAPDTD
jgi:hypothetical protein